MADLQTGPFASRTRARYALFLELTDDPELNEPVVAAAAGVQAMDWTAGDHRRHRRRRACDLGANGARRGLLLHRLTVDPALELRPVIERAVRALAEA